MIPKNTSRQASVSAPRGSLHAGHSTGVRSTGVRSTRVADLFNTDVRSILMVLTAFKGPDTWTQEERNDREQLAREVFAMAEADPQVTPDLVFYKRAFTMLMKYDDWRGVITTRNLMIESAVKEDADLGGLLDRYLVDAKARSYHEGGEW